MVRIQGPNLAIHGNLTPETQWVLVMDHYSVKDVDQLLHQHGCTQIKILQDFFWLDVDSDFQTFFVPLWLRDFCSFTMGRPEVSVEIPATRDCFNFMIYKLRQFRQKMVQALLDRQLTTACYTLSDNDLFGGKISKKTYGANRQPVYNNIADYNEFLKAQVFDHSAVALITETIEPEWHDNMTFTEKTLYPMLSLNFPVWVGGYRQAELWRAVGFDIFDDIINHDYQWETDPYLRISRALDDNSKLLTDLQHVSDLRADMKQRLLANQRSVLNNILDPYCQTILDRAGVPREVRPSLSYLSVN